MIISPSSADLYYCLFVSVDYIDEVFGDKSLWPSQPNPKAQLRILVTDFGDKVITLSIYGSALL